MYSCQRWGEVSATASCCNKQGDSGAAKACRKCQPAANGHCCPSSIEMSAPPAVSNGNVNAQQMHNACTCPFIDQGPEPYSLNMMQASRCNNNFRTTVWTGKHMQLTLMSIPTCCDIGVEIHPHLDQFIRVEKGWGVIKMGMDENNLCLEMNLCEGYAVFVPGGTWHNIINKGKCPLKLSSIYAPPQHLPGTIHRTKEEAIHCEEGY